MNGRIEFACSTCAIAAQEALESAGGCARDDLNRVLVLEAINKLLNEVCPRNTLPLARQIAASLTPARAGEPDP